MNREAAFFVILQNKMCHGSIFDSLRLRQVLTAMAAHHFDHFFVTGQFRIVGNGQGSDPLFFAGRDRIQHTKSTLGHHRCIFAWHIGSRKYQLVVFGKVDQRCIIGRIVLP